MVSWIAAIASLRYFLLIGFHLHKIAFLQQFGELLLRQRQDMLRGFLELLLLVRVDVRPLALGESVHEKCLRTAPEQDDGPVAFRSSLPRSGNPLFDDLTAKVGIDLALFGPSHRL